MKLHLARGNDTSDHFKDAIITGALLSWSSTQLRNLPWRRYQGSPYPIMVAEVLLKRTTATAVSGFYSQFLDKYPDINHLYSAKQRELEVFLQPIGLNRQRATSFMNLTRYLISKHGGLIPNSLIDLLAVPGLGPYSARAILSFGFGQRAAVVDSNVVRVLTRVYKLSGCCKPDLMRVQAIAEKLLPEDHATFNFAILDFGSLVCRPVPRCSKCPISNECLYEFKILE